ncbi:hypothetical protein U8D42_16580 [Mycobacterium europaeum]|uniref:hypothetical protein n=1 Tax=Mycobacterium europaeum TaxID=761804 RepID=UPI002ADFA0BA|nr:hypothetical protein [Mycobacterium europaeum]MEA1159916.1 hypothetical protein [Mycobacterium europaeum]
MTRAPVKLMAIQFRELEGQMIPRLLVGVALILGAASWSAASANADPSPFSTLSCACHETAPAGSSSVIDNVDWGIQQGLSDLPTLQVER